MLQTFINVNRFHAMLIHKNKLFIFCLALTQRKSSGSSQLEYMHVHIRIT